MKITIQDKVEKAKVSVATVSRVIKIRGAIQKKTKKRVLPVIKEFYHHPNALTREVVGRRTKIYDYWL